MNVGRLLLLFCMYCSTTASAEFFSEVAPVRSQRRHRQGQVISTDPNDEAVKQMPAKLDEYGNPILFDEAAEASDNESIVEMMTPVQIQIRARGQKSCTTACADKGMECDAEATRNMVPKFRNGVPYTCVSDSQNIEGGSVGKQYAPFSRSHSVMSEHAGDVCINAPVSTLDAKAYCDLASQREVSGQDEWDDNRFCTCSCRQCTGLTSVTLPETKANWIGTNGDPFSLCFPISISASGANACGNHYGKWQDKNGKVGTAGKWYYTQCAKLPNPKRNNVVECRAGPRCCQNALPTGESESGTVH